MNSKDTIINAVLSEISYLGSKIGSYEQYYLCSLGSGGVGYVISIVWCPGSLYIVHNYIRCS